jgi:hypothetical protein
VLDLQGGKMGATSATGTGQGMSHGVQKPENHCGCGCGTPEEDKPAKKKIGCLTRVKSCNTANVKVGSSSSIRVCS